METESAVVVKALEDLGLRYRAGSDDATSDFSVTRISTFFPPYVRTIAIRGRGTVFEITMTDHLDGLTEVLRSQGLALTFTVPPCRRPIEFRVESIDQDAEPVSTSSP